MDPARDRSLSFHEAHSPQREVEVLHDQLLAAFNADPTLRPRDVIVMVPDINVYAPHIQAVFGRHDAGDLRHIPFTISDQGQRHHEPVLIALETLMGLPQSRFAVSEILSLLEIPGVRQRFGIAEEDIPLARRWVEGANIRWGLHRQQRETLTLPDDLSRNTWQAGLRAMLLGYSMGDDGAWSEIEPYPEIGGLEAGLAGRLSAFVQQLEALWHQLQAPQTPPLWEALFADMLSRFFQDLEGNDLLLLNRFRRQLEQWLEDALAAGLAETPLPLGIVRDALLAGLDEHGLNQRFLAGKVNFATLMPMRAIPFRVVCLLGMNDGDYPRSRPPVDFDLMANDYRPGDRSRREDDRYLFLEALLSAREQLYISWVGRSIRDDSERPPSVLVSQLQDHLNSLWRISNQPGQQVTTALTTCHPLQPFSQAYFPLANALQPEADSPPRPLTEILQQRSLFTYEKEWRSAHSPDRLGSADLNALPWQPPEEPLTLAELANFLKRPVETFFQRRLQVRFDEVEDDDTDNENFDLDGLDRWRLDQELIDQAVLKSADGQELQHRIEQTLDRLARRGELGMGLTEHHLRQTLAERLPDLHQRYREALDQWPEALAEPVVFQHRFSNDLGSVELLDLIGGLRIGHDGARCRLVVSRSSLLTGSGNQKKVRYANLMNDWVVHLAGQLTDQPFQTRILGKEENRNVIFHPLPREQAQKHLDAILGAWMKATTQVLPLHCDAAFAWIYSFYQSRSTGDHDRAIQSSADTFEAALARDSGYLRRAFATSAQLVTPAFEGLLHQLYLPLWEAEQNKSAREQIEGQS